MVLQQSIDAEEDEILTISLKSAVFPNSFYNLSAVNQNNTITFQEAGQSQKTITLPEGSYNIDELMLELKLRLDEASDSGFTYALTYNEIDNHVTIKKNGFVSGESITFDFTPATSSRRFFGFTSGTYVIDTADGIVSNRGVDISDTQNALYVRLPNLNNAKVIESNNNKFSNIIAVVPIPLSRNTFFVYEPNHPFVCELVNRSISAIEILITFQEATENINFQNCDYELNFEVGFKKHHRSYLNSNQKLMSHLFDRVLKHEEKIRQEQESQKVLEDVMEDLRKQNKIYPTSIEKWDYSTSLSQQGAVSFADSSTLPVIPSTQLSTPSERVKT